MHFAESALMRHLRHLCLNEVRCLFFYNYTVNFLSERIIASVIKIIAIAFYVAYVNYFCVDQLWNNENYGGTRLGTRILRW